MKTVYTVVGVLWGQEVSESDDFDTREEAEALLNSLERSEVDYFIQGWIYD